MPDSPGVDATKGQRFACWGGWQWPQVVGAARDVRRRFEGKYFPFTTFHRLIAHTRLTLLFYLSKCFAIEITKNYKLVEFREDLKDLFRITGVQNKPTVFLFDETQIVVETFLEDINNVLTSGEVPNLFAKDELGGLCEDVRAEVRPRGFPKSNTLFLPPLFDCSSVLLPVTTVTTTHGTSVLFGPVTPPCLPIVRP